MHNFKRLLPQFNYALKWNTIEAVLYQTLLVAHQMLLYHTINRALFGIIGTLFALIYLAILIGNVGLDQILTVHYTLLAASKQSFRKLLIPQAIVQSCFFALIPSIVFFTAPSSWYQHQLSGVLWVLLGGIVCMEALKKNMRIFAQNAFLNRHTATIEMIAIVVYVVMVWGLFMSGFPITPYTIFFPFFLQSCISVAMLARLVFKVYQSLPDSSHDASNNSTSATYYMLNKTLIKSRLACYGYQLTHMFFTGNFLISFFAYMYGPVVVSSLKLTNTMAVFISVILERIFGVSGGALFAHIKSSIYTEKNAAFIHVNQVLYAALACIATGAAFCALIWHIPTAVMLFFGLLFFENLFIVYDRLFVVEGKSYILCIINGIIALCIYSLLYMSSTLSLMYALVAIFIARLLAFSLVIAITPLTITVDPSSPA